MADPIKPSTYILAIIAFCFVIMVGMGLISEFRQADPTFVENDQTQEFNNTFNIYDRLSNSIQSLQTSVEPPSNILEALGVVGTLLLSAFNGLLLLFQTFSFMNYVFAGLGIFGVPGWIGGIISWIIIVSIVFAIWSAIFNSDT
jgi:hypothetical protein